MGKNRQDRFRSWLQLHDFIEVLDTIGEWEVARWKIGSRTFVVYRNKSGEISFSGDESKRAWRTFTSKGVYTAPFITLGKRERDRLELACGLAEAAQLDPMTEEFDRFCDAAMRAFDAVIAADRKGRRR